MIIAVDFDGVLFKDGYPGVGEPILDNINYIKFLQERGHRLILWTCRDEIPLQVAVEACAAYGIHFVSVNAPDPELKWDGPSSCKVYADLYIDDRTVNPKTHKLDDRILFGD